MLSLSAVDRVCEYRLETTAELIAVGLLESGRPGRAVNAKRGVPHSLAPIREKVPDLRDLCRALLRTRTADLLLTIQRRRGKRGQARVTATKKAPETRGFAAERVTRVDARGPA